ncbi:MAG: 50S ribosomal protein L25 [Candidatus Eremiobacteraeota bacterium]|nr:50S ribosomal protein L25 [Candidatus Eremiobacteraeota bacterium]
MSKPHTVSSLTLEPRSATGTTAAHALRAAGKIPGVVYGHGAPTPIAIDAHQLTDLVLSGNKSHIVEARIDGKKDSVLLRRIDADPISRKPLSVEFQRVTKNEAIYATVPVVTTGNPIGVRDQGGVLDVVTHSLEVRGPAAGIPDHLTVDVTDLAVHTHKTAGDIPLPKGFTLVTPPETVVVSVEITRAGAGTGSDNAEEQPTEAPAG